MRIKKGHYFECIDDSYTQQNRYEKPIIAEGFQNEQGLSLREVMGQQHEFAGKAVEGYEYQVTKRYKPDAIHPSGVQLSADWFELKRIGHYDNKCDYINVHRDDFPNHFKKLHKTLERFEQSVVLRWISKIASLIIVVGTALSFFGLPPFG